MSYTDLFMVFRDKIQDITRLSQNIRLMKLISQDLKRQENTINYLLCLLHTTFTWHIRYGYLLLYLCYVNELPCSIYHSISWLHSVFYCWYFMQFFMSFSYNWIFLLPLSRSLLPPLLLLWDLIKLKSMKAQHVNVFGIPSIHFSMGYFLSR